MSDWRDRARCAGMDPDLFFPERGPIPAEVQAVCAECEVRFECLDYAVRNVIDHGVWGGLGAKDRMRFRRQRAKKDAAA